MSSSNQHILNKPRALYDFVFIESMKNGMLSSHAQLWHAHRKMTAPLFLYKRFPAYLAMINKYSSRISLACPKMEDTLKGEKIEDLLSSVSIKIISEFLVGQNSRSERESDNLHHLVRNVKWLMNYRMIHRPENSFLPIWYFNPKRKEYNDQITAITEIVHEDIDKCVDKAMLNRKSGTKSDNPFTSLVEEMLGAGATVSEIRDEVDTFFLAVMRCFQRLALIII